MRPEKSLQNSHLCQDGKDLFYFSLKSGSVSCTVQDTHANRPSPAHIRKSRHPDYPALNHAVGPLIEFAEDSDSDAGLQRYLCLQARSEQLRPPGSFPRPASFRRKLNGGHHPPRRQTPDPNCAQRDHIRSTRQRSIESRASARTDSQPVMRTGERLSGRSAESEYLTGQNGLHSGSACRSEITFGRRSTQPDSLKPLLRSPRALP